MHLRAFAVMVVLLIIGLFLSGCSSTTSEVPEVPEEEELPSTVPVQQPEKKTPLSTQEFIDGFNALFDKHLKQDIELSMEELTVYDDTGVVVYEIGEENKFIANYADLFSFALIQSETDAQLYLPEVDRIAQELPSGYVIKWVVEEEGVAASKYVNEHLMVAYNVGNLLRDHDYFKWVYSYCSPRFVVKIKADKTMGGAEMFVELSTLFDKLYEYGVGYDKGMRGYDTDINQKKVLRDKYNPGSIVLEEGAEYNSGIRSYGTVEHNIKTMQLFGPCTEPPEDFNEGFVHLYEEGEIEQEV